MKTLAQIGGGYKGDNASASQKNFQRNLLTGAGSFLDCPFRLHRLLTQPLRNFG